MRLMGFLLLVAGWALVLTALALLPSGPSQISFALIAFGVEALGLTFVFRSHLISGRDRK
jgi:hypothetical protein